MKKSKKTKYTCINCDAVKDVYRGASGKFCSRACVNDFYSKNEGSHPNNRFRFYKDTSGYLRKNKWLNGKNSGIWQHRQVMEQFLCRKLLRSEIVHHKNGIKTDNRIENLEILTRSQHAKEHWKEDAYRNRMMPVLMKNRTPFKNGFDARRKKLEGASRE